MHAAGYGSQVPNIEPVNSPALYDEGNGVYTIGQFGGNTPTGDVPVGTVLSYTVQPPYGHTKIIEMMWSGGTNVLSYFGTPSNQPWIGTKNTDAVPESPTMQTEGQWSPNPNLTFVVDAVPRSYAVTIQVVYEDGSVGDATIDFTSIAPMVSFNPAPVAGTNNSGNQNGSEFISSGSQGWNPIGAGINIHAETMTGEFGGSFMFMQVANATHKATLADGSNWTMPTQGGGPALDNSNDPPANFIGGGSEVNEGAPGYPVWDLVTGQDNANTQGWSEYANQAQTHYMWDTPFIYVPNTAKSESANDSFTTYVMYKPDDNGVVADWVAIGKVVWSWGGKATNNGGWMFTPNPPVAPSTSTQLTTTSDMFPSWTDQTLAQFARGPGGWIQS